MECRRARRSVVTLPKVGHRVSKRRETFQYLSICSGIVSRDS